VRSKLAAARDELGWSQARLISELKRRGRAAGFAVMGRSSLKTALSRWENAHFVPDQHYRRLLRDIFGATDDELGFASVTVCAVDQNLRSVQIATGSTQEAPRGADASADIRRRIDQLMDADAAVCVAGLEERVSLQAQDCVRVAPPTMLDRVLSDFEDVQALLQQPPSPALMSRLYEIAANLSALVGDELMVFGRPADSQAWYTTAKAAALRADSSRVLARVLSLNASSTSTTEPQRKAVALAQQTYALDSAGPAPALATSVEAFAQARLGNEVAARHALRHSQELLEKQDQEDSVFGFTERRQLFYRGRTVLRIAKVVEARAVLNDALSSYPLDVVGDPAVLRLDLAERLVVEGDLLQAAELAISVLADLRPEHRTGLFTHPGRRVLAGVTGLGRHHVAVDQLEALTAQAS
jgi:hypothetical protein